MTSEDFGFSDNQTTQPKYVDWKSKFLTLKSMILPLLNNLSKNPDIENIHWPNRKERIDKFLDDIEKLENK